MFWGLKDHPRNVFVKIENKNTNNLKVQCPKLSNLNKMKRQRNTQQIKEQDKCPPNQTKEEEIGNLPDKENSTNCQNTERTPQTQQFKQDEETEEYSADKGTG